MDEELKPFLNRPFEEKIGSHFLKKHSLRTFKDISSQNHLLITDIESRDRRKVVLDTLRKTGWKEAIPDSSETKEECDYVYSYGTYFTPKKLYDLFYRYNGKIIILDNDTVLSIKSLRDVLMGAVCSNPEWIDFKSSKWPIRLEGRKEFFFRGKVIVLTSLKEDELQNNEKYRYLKRDMIIPREYKGNVN